MVQLPYFFQWRVMTPALSIAFLWAHVGMLLLALRRRGRFVSVAAGISSGLLFWVYFYYWTAAALALAICWALSPGGRRAFVPIFGIGCSIGIVPVVTNALAKRRFGTDWLQRSHKFYHVPHWDSVYFPKAILLLLLLALFVCWIRHRDLLPIAALAASGWLLERHQVLTGLETENNHWSYVTGWALGLLVLVMLAREVSVTRFNAAAQRLIWLVALFEIGSGLLLRKIETAGQPVSRQWSEAWQRYHDQMGTPGRHLLARRGVVGGDPYFSALAAIELNTRTLNGGPEFYSPRVTNIELAERDALEGWLRGLSADDYQAEKQGLVDPYAMESKLNPSSSLNRLPGLLAAFARVAADPESYLDKFSVRYFAVDSRDRLALRLRPGWRRIIEGPYWQVWERMPTAKSEP